MGRQLNHVISCEGLYFIFSFLYLGPINTGETAQVDMCRFWLYGHDTLRWQ